MATTPWAIMNHTAETTAVGDRATRSGLSATATITRAVVVAGQHRMLTDPRLHHTPCLQFRRVAVDAVVVLDITDKQKMGRSDRIMFLGGASPVVNPVFKTLSRQISALWQNLTVSAARIHPQVDRYRGDIRIAPSSRIVSPFSIGLAIMLLTSSAYSSGLPSRLGKGVC